MLRNIGAAILGLATAVILVILIEWLGHVIYPPPPDLDTNDADAMRTFYSQLPLLALLFPMIAWFVGTFSGTLLACFIGTARPIAFAVAIGTLMLAATISNLILIPHPLWFSIISVAGVAGCAWLAMQFAPNVEASNDYDLLDLD